MAIRGRLDELQASEVLQFLTQSGRSGTLRFREGRRSKYLSFEMGRLVFAVNQHELPPLAEVLHQRGLIESDDQQAEQRFDEELTRALEWRRSGVHRPMTAAFPHTRLGYILVACGCLTKADLEAALAPRNIPESVLEDVLVHSGVISKAGMAELRSKPGSKPSLHDAILSSDALTAEQVTAAIACMADQTLSRLLVATGCVKSNDAAYCLEHLEALRGDSRPQFRIGEYLVVSGKLTQRQLERALGAQLSRYSMLGEILVDQGVLTEEDIAEAEQEIAELRLEFSPLRVLREALVRDNGFTRERFATAREEQIESDKTLAAILVETGRIAEADLRKKFEDSLCMELTDLMFWQEGEYEFFEGLSLADALGDEGLGRIHTYSFEVSSLLLDAHYRADELRRTVFCTLGPATILLGTTPTENTEDVADVDARLLARMDGKRPLSEVCSVLPGNLLTHAERISGFVDKGLAVPLTRQHAFEKGQASMRVKEFALAITFFKHAMRTEGEGPEVAELRMWIQHARLAKSRRVFKRITHAAHRGLRYVASRSLMRGMATWCSRHELVARPCRWFAALWHGMRRRWIQGSRRTALTIQDFMIQKGFARHWWTVRRCVVNPIAGWSGRPAPKVMTSVVAVLMAAVALMIPGVADIDHEAGRSVPENPDNPLRALRAPIRKMRFDSPVETSPEVTANALFVTTRDGVLHGIPLARGAKTKEWKVQLGEYGDLLSPPARFKDTLFVTNVRGAVHAVTTQGKRLWTRLFPRVERIVPVVIPLSRTESAGLAIAARESLFILHPDDGRILYRLRCGNVIEAPPVVDGDRIFVGSADNHVYCADWRKKQVLWDTEVGQDVLSLVRVEDTLITHVRGGYLVALRCRDGAVVWRKIEETRRVQSIRELHDGRFGLVLQDGGGEVCDGATGEVARTVPAVKHEATVRMYLADSSAFYYSERGDIGQVDEHGERLWQLSNSLLRITSFAIRRNSLVVSSRDGNVWIFSLRRTDSRRKRTDD